MFRRAWRRSGCADGAAQGQACLTAAKGERLDGIKIAVPEHAARGEFLGFCIVLPTGPVQVLYKNAGDGVWDFDMIERGPR